MSESVAQVRVDEERASARALRVAVLGGGASGEREVSLASARGVKSALDTFRRDPHGRFEIVELRDVELERDGRWMVAGRPLEAARALAELEDLDVFFLCLHGGAGENGTIQGLLEAAGRRHTGSGVGASALCMDKLALRSLAQGQGMRVAPGACLSERDWRAAPLAERARLEALSRTGWVVKPRSGGSSVDTSIVLEARALAPAIERVLAGGDDALVEARIEGVELSCGVLEDPSGEPCALPPIEIQPRDGRFFDYEQKYAAQGAREVCPPQSVDASSIARVRALAERIHRTARCSGYSRTDFIVPPAPEGFGEPVLLEVNTLPGMTERSLLPQEASVAGISYGELCLRILGAALRAQRTSP